MAAVDKLRDPSPTSFPPPTLWFHTLLPPRHSKAMSLVSEVALTLPIQSPAYSIEKSMANPPEQTQILKALHSSSSRELRNLEA